MDQIRKNTRSTKNAISTTKNNKNEMQNNKHQEKATSDNEIQAQEPNNIPTHQVFATIDETGKIYTDQTGRFPVRSSNGKQYVLVLYDYDSNAILTEAIKNRTGPELLRAYTKLHQYLVQRGFQPQVHWLDNEASSAMKAYDTTNSIQYQLVPPHMHRRNAAERAIRTWKNHFTAGICSTNSKFPMHLWC